jgi:membrane protease YdiL (CAAX protease family)
MQSQTNWRTEAVFLLLGGVTMSFCLGSGLVGILHQAGVAAFKSEESFAAILLATLCFHGVLLALAVPFLKFHQGGWREAFGLQAPGLGEDLVLALKVLGFILPVAWGLQALCAYTFTRLHWNADEQISVDLLLRAPSLGLRIYLALFAVVVAPVAEEFLFRGVLFPFMQQQGYRWLAWLVPSLIFALIHLNLPTLLPLFVLALTLTWLYHRTGRLAANIAVHSLFNAANVILLFLFKP